MCIGERRLRVCELPLFPTGLPCAAALPAIAICATAYPVLTLAAGSAQDGTKVSGFLDGSWQGVDFHRIRRLSQPGRSRRARSGGALPCG
jgi:hypothetical protein